MLRVTVTLAALAVIPSFGVLHKPMAVQHNIKIIDHFGKVEKGGHGGSKACLTKIDVNIFTQEPDLTSNLAAGRKKIPNYLVKGAETNIFACKSSASRPLRISFICNSSCFVRKDCITS